MKIAFDIGCNEGIITEKFLKNYDLVINIEYNEYINVRPEKIKHYEYIKNNAISDNYKDLLYKFTKIGDVQ